MYSSTEHEGVIDDAAEKIGRDDDDGPRLIPHHEEHRELQQHQEEHFPFEERIHSKEFLNLRIFLCELQERRH